MRCEICGRQIHGEPLKATIEGANMIVCRNCAKLGRVHPKATPLPTHTRSRITTKQVVPKFSSEKIARKTVETLELIEDYSPHIRHARERCGLSHEDLGQKIGEKVSVLKKIETGKMTPNHQLAEKLEHALRIKLLVPPSEVRIPASDLPRPPEITLGKIVHLKKRKAETLTE